MAADAALSLSIAELAAAYRRGEANPVEVTQAALDRIARIDGRLNSFVTLTEDLAHTQARTARDELARGVERGPLQGVPIALKDLYATRGIRTSAHSRVLLDWIPEEDATATSRLHAAGAVLLGKLAMHEFAYGGPSSEAAFPPARNPWNTDCVTGGSSSGSGAAVAARLCFGSLGSDTGGSIRNPAHLCGITGIKPTYGRVSRHGVVPLSWSLDHCGPMARTVEDCAIMLQAIAGHDPLDHACAEAPVPDYRAGLAGSIRGLRLGVPRSWFDEGEGTDPEVLAAFEEALRVLRDAGAETVELDGTPFIDARPANTIILMAEAYAYHEPNLKSRPQDYGGVRDRLREGGLLSAADYIHAQRARTAISRQLGTMLDQVDAFVSPAGPRVAARFDAFDPDAAYRTPSYTHAFNLSGLPAMSVPCGFSASGLPIGLQIAGRAFDEATVLRLGHAFQQVTDWHTRAPAVE